MIDCLKSQFGHYQTAIEYDHWSLTQKAIDLLIQAEYKVASYSSMRIINDREKNTAAKQKFFFFLTLRHQTGHRSDNMYVQLKASKNICHQTVIVVWILFNIIARARNNNFYSYWAYTPVTLVKQKKSYMLINNLRSLFLFQNYL